MLWKNEISWNQSVAKLLNLQLFSIAILLYGRYWCPGLAANKKHIIWSNLSRYFSLWEIYAFTQYTGSNGTRCDAWKNIIFTQMTKLINETKNLPMCLRLTIYKYHFLVSNFLYISIITLPIDQLSKLFCPERKKRYQEKNSSRKFPLVHVHDVVCMKSVGIIHIKQLSFTWKKNSSWYTYNVYIQL